jgi:hypothetical protein
VVSSPARGCWPSFDVLLQRRRRRTRFWFWSCFYDVLSINCKDHLIFFFS